MLIKNIDYCPLNGYYCSSVYSCKYMYDRFHVYECDDTKGIIVNAIHEQELKDRKKAGRKWKMEKWR